jgi:hypothetical protein
LAGGDRVISTGTGRRFRVTRPLIPGCKTAFFIAFHPLIRARVDAPGEGFSLFRICDPVEDIECGSEQDRGKQPPVHSFPVLPVEQLRCRLQDGDSAFLHAGRRSGRRAGRLSAALRHQEFSHALLSRHSALQINALESRG